MAGTPALAPKPAARSTTPAQPAAPAAAPPARISPPAKLPSPLQTGPPAIRLSTGASIAAPDNITGLTGGGEPLLPAIQKPIERSLNVNLEAVRVHTDGQAQQTTKRLSARAFTYGNHIFLGPGEQATDLTLMAHEATHVVHQQAAAMPQRLAPGQSDPLEREAHQAAGAVLRGEPFTVHERVSSPRVQRFGFPNPLNYLAEKANLIPGFRMFTVILGVNPINMSKVDRSAANILRALIEVMPGGTLISEALQNHGVFDKVGAWVEQQIQTLGMVGSSIKQAVTTFIDSLGLRDLADLGGAWERAKRIFTEPIDRIISFAKGLVTDIIKFIKDAILLPLAKLAEGTKGWDLLIAILGKNPITGEAVPRTAETLIGGFMKLIGQEEVWENMKKANAVPRAWAWFQGAMKDLLGFVSQIPTLAINAFKSLVLMDIILVPRAFLKVATVFANFIGDFITWAGKAVWNLLEIIFDVVARDAIPYLKNVAAAFKTILKNPIGFVLNLVNAGKLGFEQFAKNIGKHLKASLLEWLTGSLTGVYIPKSLDFFEIVKFVLSVLGLTWQNIREKLVKAVGETAVKAMETGFDIVKKLVTEGPAAAWEEIQKQLSNLKDMAIQAIMDFVVDTVVKKAVAKVISLLVPGGAFIQAILTIYETIKVFISKLKKIIQVAKAFLDSIVAIANGQIGPAAERVETTLAGLLTLAISFLAGFASLGKIADKVMDIINTKIRAPVFKVLDKVVDWIVTMAKKLFAKAFGKKDKDGKQVGDIPDIDTPVKFGDELHMIRVHLDGERVVFLFASESFGNMRQKLDAMSKTYAAPFREFGINNIADDIDKRINTVKKVVDRGEGDMTKQLKGVTDPFKRASIFMKGASSTSSEMRAALEKLGKQLTGGKLGKAIFGKAAKLKPGDPVVFLNPERAMVVREVKQLREIGGQYELLFMAESSDGSFKSPLLYREEGSTWNLINKPHHESFKAQGIGGRVVIDKVHLNSGSRGSYKPPFLGQTIGGKTFAIKGHLVAYVFGGPAGKDNIVALTTEANEEMRSGIEVPLSKEIKAKDSVYVYTARPVYLGGNTSQPVYSVKVEAIKIYPNKSPKKVVYPEVKNA